MSARTAVLTLTAAALSAAVVQAGTPLFRDAAPPPGIQAFHHDIGVVRRRHVTVDFAALANAETRPVREITLNLFADGRVVRLEAVLDRLEKTVGGFAWIGRIEGEPLGSVTFAIDRGAGILSGNVSLPRGFYAVRHAGGRRYVIEEIDHSAFPDDEVVEDVTGEGESAAQDVTALDDGTLIDVMVVYTPAARSAVGGTTAMNNLVDLAVSEANVSYSNSGIRQRLRLVHRAEVAYTESGSFSTDLSRLSATSDGYIDNVHSLRNTYGADLVSMVVNGSSPCGIGYLMTTVSSSFASRGFNVVSRSCATGYYSFGHELGHNMGARHDRAVDNSDGPYTYNHGYTAPSDGWRTVMAYGNACGNCTRIQFWSNPDVFRNGERMGIPEGQSGAADNRKTLNNTAFTVANFRQAVGTVPRPTPTPTPTPRARVTPTPTPTPTPTGAPTATPTPGGLSGYYRVHARHSGKVLSVQSASTANSANVFQWTYGGTTANDEWLLLGLGSGYHRIVNRHSGRDMVVQSASTAEGANIFQYAYGGTTTNDEWAIVSLGTGYYRITNRHSGKSAEVVGGGTTDGANVAQRTYGGALYQQFQLVSIP